MISMGCKSVSRYCEENLLGKDVEMLVCLVENVLRCP